MSVSAVMAKMHLKAYIVEAAETKMFRPGDGKGPVWCLQLSFPALQNFLLDDCGDLSHRQTNDKDEFVGRSMAVSEHT